MCPEWVRLSRNGKEPELIKPLSNLESIAYITKDKSSTGVTLKTTVNNNVQVFSDFIINLYFSCLFPSSAKTVHDLSEGTLAFCFYDSDIYFCLLSPRRTDRWDLPASTPSSSGTEWRTGSEIPGASGGRIRGRKTVGKQQNNNILLMKHTCSRHFR